MIRISTQKHLPTKRKTISVRSTQDLKRAKQVVHKLTSNNKKIPEIINELQNNLRMLKKYYNEQLSHHQQNRVSSNCKRPNRALSSSSKNKKKTEDPAEEQTTTLAQIDDLKKSFMNTHGYETNNIVQLYNFYKKNLEKSTRLFGSTSMSNMINLTHNHSEIKDKVIMRPSTSYVVASDQYVKQEDKKQIPKNELFINNKKQNVRLPSILVDNLSKKNNEMVNVATLLAEKKKISRKNICQNMNCESLLNQAKRKLLRPHPNDNIERFYKLKQNLRSQNVKASPIRIKNSMLPKQRSSSKKSNRKQISGQKIESRQDNVIVQEEFYYKDINKHEQVIQEQQAKVSERQKTKFILESQKQDIQLKQMRSAKSSKSVKSIVSPNSIKSPSLNKAVLLDLTINGDEQKNKVIQPLYFVPRVHTNPHDSLLDCQITPKQQSRIVDLESIPFDF